MNTPTAKTCIPALQKNRFVFCVFVYFLVRWNARTRLSTNVTEVIDSASAWNRPIIIPCSEAVSCSWRAGLS